MQTTVIYIFATVIASSVNVNAETATAFINQAQTYDNMYASDSDADQQKALTLYSSALAAEPDDKQRLHILFRMAQLNGSAYQLEKGEKPNFQKAIGLYQQIIDSYPADEPLVLKSITSICDHHTTLRNFETALKWAKKTLKYDFDDIELQIDAAMNEQRILEEYLDEDTEWQEGLQQQAELLKQKEKVRLLKRTLKSLKRYQTIAVDQVAYTADLIDPLRAHGELRAIADEYAGTFIGERAAEKLQENMDRMSNMWIPPENETAGYISNLQPSGISQVEPDPNKPAGKPHTSYVSDLAGNATLIKSDQDVKSQHDDFVEQPRGPPPGALSGPIYFICAAGLTVSGLAVFLVKRVRKKRTNSY